MIRDGVTSRVVTDELGSVRRVVNTSTGTVEQTIEYDPQLGRWLSKDPLGFIAYDRYTIGQSLLSGGGIGATNAAALGADVALAFVPFGTGGGPAVRGGAKAGSGLSEEAASYMARRRFPYPATADEELGGVYRQLFRAEDTRLRGTGGALLRDGSHAQEARERANQIERILRRRTDLSDYDRNKAIGVRDHLLEGPAETP